jgi:hypothetical protein
VDLNVKNLRWESMGHSGIWNQERGQYVPKMGYKDPFGILG